ncbi:MAG: hypothetical protein A3A86_07440 [Elusimicrobia bacterium RIFCSPLOWO2_01_FULL_60_11]|nr:MAG: hypothetical protein A3A86_07440 [Elusimicrobia bacterium RIFCSPLOWO2_01_FULL_60_11]
MILVDAKSACLLGFLVAVSGCASSAGKKADPGTDPQKQTESSKDAPKAAQAQTSKTGWVEKISICTSVKDREPEGEGAEFTSVSRLYCWTSVRPPSVPAVIKHVWRSGGKTMSTVALKVKYSPSRTWSTLAVTPGSWSVDVVSESGEVLSTAEFTVK